MNILVLKAGEQEYDADFLANLNKYGAETDNLYTLRYLDHLIFEFTDEVKVKINGKDVLDYDFVYFRTWEKRPAIAATLAKHLLANSKKFIDSSVGLSNVGSKILQNYLMLTNGLPSPKCFVVYKNFLKEELQLQSEKLGGYPIVLKATKGSEGKGVYLLHKFEDLVELYDSLNDDHYFLQEFIPNDFDYRFVIFGEKVCVIKKRVRAKDSAEFRNNVSLGAQVEYIDPATLPEMCEIALKAARVKNLQVAGVDLVTSNKDNKTYIFEVNPAPAFRNDFTVLKYFNNYLKSIFE